MSKLHILIITFLYFMNTSYSENKINDNVDGVDRGVISELLLKQMQNLIIKKVPVNKFKNIVAKKSSGIVLIYTISEKGKDKENFYNSAMKPRKTKKSYKYGVTCGVILSSDGIVVTTYNATVNSDKYIISIDSDKNQSDELYGEIELNANTYNAHVLKTFPDLNLVFLKIDVNKSENFEFINLANDEFLIDRNGNTNHLLYNAIAIGKCKGEHFVRKSCAFNNKNKFQMLTTVIGNITYKIIEGVPTLVLKTPLTCDGVLPENHGGAILDGNGKLLGIPTWLEDDYTMSLPLSFAIPSSTIKKCFGLIEYNKISKIEMKSFCGLKTQQLNKVQKNMLKEQLKYSSNSLQKKIKDYLNNNLLANSFSSINDFIDSDQLGVVVSGVKEGSIADKAKINVGDILFMFNDDCITNPKAFRNLEIYSIDKSSIMLTLVRNNKIITMEVRK